MTNDKLETDLQLLKTSWSKPCFLINSLICAALNNQLDPTMRDINSKLHVIGLICRGTEMSGCYDNKVI